MKQIIQDPRRGVVGVEEVPIPALKSGGVLIRTVASSVSPGTERLALEFGRKSLLRKAWERPDLVQQILDKARREGVVSAYMGVKGRLDNPISLGYSSAGIVEGVGDGTGGFQIGDRVACAGAGYASHAEMVWVPMNLCVHVPENVSLDDAAFTTMGAIALQGLRLAEPTLGEYVVVIGLGLIGQIVLQCLKATGCHVFGIDREADRVALACELGADEAALDDKASIVKRVSAFARGRGADAVIIAAATESSGPIELAGEICRQKGRVVVVGAVGMNIPRRSYYDRELTVKVSMSYGPGRYDPIYEEKGIDYPIGYVRWTERRNMEAFLDLLAEAKVNLQKLITHRFPIQDAEKAYDLLAGKRNERYLGILLTYADKADAKRTITLASNSSAVSASSNRVNLGLIGVGSFAKSTLLPALKRLSSVSFKGIATSNGASSKSSGTRYGFQYCATDYQELLKDEEIGAVIIATPHRLHAPMIMEALKAGKHVFVEKPLCIRENELNDIVETYQKVSGPKGEGCPFLMVGFNRRFSAYTQKAREFFAARKSPLMVHYRINAGPLPSNHWANDQEEGGGRIIGEVCHFVDFTSFLVGRHPIQVFAQGASPDTVSVLLKYGDGSMGTIHYVTTGHRAFPKERLEIFGEGKVFVIDDFKRAEWASDRDRGSMRSWFRQDKGHRAEVKAFVDAVLEGRPSPVDPNEAFQTTHATFKIVESLSRGVPVEVP